ICLLGVRVAHEQVAEAVQYLERYVRGRYVRLRRPLPDSADGAYVYLKNGLFVNRKMIEMGVAQADEQQLHPFRERFLRAREA
ncbi:MAG: site-specific DNA-methyltransferase, partial [Anaerolineae bacterium]|nr:site-specific DNA-methyltransferase [Anaerolineae bacterium]